MALKTKKVADPVEIVRDEAELVEVTLRENQDGDLEQVALWDVPQEDGTMRRQSFREVVDRGDQLAKTVLRQAPGPE